MKKVKEKYKNITRPSFMKTLKGFNFPNLSLDINGLVRNSIPTSDRIPGTCVKRTLPQVKLPAGKTISLAYNKGNYQVVDVSDFKTMGRKI
jgi:hypothetical protein|tara:strand:- start:4263 stop:4535 length:273 start_codon:yes stop_codon:yes gene_type:complete